jgi:hypothetical protein
LGQEVFSITALRARLNNVNSGEGSLPGKIKHRRNPMLHTFELRNLKALPYQELSLSLIHVK